MTSKKSVSFFDENDQQSGSRDNFVGFQEKQGKEDQIYQMMVMEPVSLKEIDEERSSFFDSDNFRELSSDESFSQFENEEGSQGQAGKGEFNHQTRPRNNSIPVSDRRRGKD